MSRVAYLVVHWRGGVHLPRPHHAIQKGHACVYEISVAFQSGPILGRLMRQDPGW